MIDKKGIFSFLIITFTLTYTIEFTLMALGVSFIDVPPMFAQLVIAGVMWIPALAALITIKFVTKEGFEITNLRIGSWKPYIYTLIIVPVIFFTIYLITWALDLGYPDWKLTEFSAMLESHGVDTSEMPSPSILLFILLLTSITVAPFFNGIFGFGEEFGWRGYLLPKLMPLGKPCAYISLGVIWSLWHAPLVMMGFKYSEHVIEGLIIFTLLLTAIGIFMNEMTLRYKSSILAGFIHGALNAQFYGVWAILFINVNPVFGGSAGLIAVCVWLVVSFYSFRKIQWNSKLDKSV